MKKSELKQLIKEELSNLSSISKKLETSNEELINIINTAVENYNDSDLK